MPLYEYHCQNCGQEVELLVGDRQQPACPDCGSEKLTKLLSVVASPARESPTGCRLTDGPVGPCGGNCGCFPGG